MPLEELPHVDEHAVVVAAPPGAVWDAALRTMHRSFSGASTERIARVLGAQPADVSGWDRPGVGSSIVGFGVVEADPPHLLAVAGRHRFAKYAIVLRTEPAGRDTRCRLETRAEFPGLHGRLYRAAVIGTRGHVVVVRRILGGIKRSAERAPRQ